MRSKRWVTDGYDRVCLVMSDGNGVELIKTQTVDSWEHDPENYQKAMNTVKNLNEMLFNVDERNDYRLGDCFRVKPKQEYTPNLLTDAEIDRMSYCGTIAEEWDLYTLTRELKPKDDVTTQHISQGSKVFQVSKTNVQ